MLFIFCKIFLKEKDFCGWRTCQRREDTVLNQKKFRDTALEAHLTYGPSFLKEALNSTVQ